MNAPDFTRERLTGLGGSDMAAVLGLSPYKSAVDVWLEKTGRAAPQDGTLQMRFGSYAEEFVAREYSDATGRAVQRFNPMLRHPDYPMVIGHIDRLVVPDGAKIAAHKREIRTDRLLECKTASAFAASNAAEWGLAGTDNVPTQYLVQIAVYAALTGCQYADLAVLFGNQELRVYNLRRDLELEREILARAAEWWKRHIEGDIEPDPRDEADVLKLYPRDNQLACEATAEVSEAVKRLAAIKLGIKKLEDDEQAERDIITAHMGEAGVLTYQGSTLATWKAAKDSIRTDWKAVANAAHAPAEIIAAHTTTTPGSRRLLLK
jgi:putative phage-type endonuclease